MPRPPISSVLAKATPLLLLAMTGRNLSAQGTAPVSPRQIEASSQAIASVLTSVQRSQELFRGQQRMYARSLGQLGEDVAVRDSVYVTLSNVSATGYVATGRHLGAPTLVCVMVVGDAPTPPGFLMRETGRPVCDAKRGSE